MINYKEYMDFAVQTAYDAGKLTLGYFQTGIDVDFKSDDSPVTIADKKAEELIRSRIEKAYPSHSIVGEEFGNKESDSEFKWYIDPIDGTKSFIRGVPLYAVLIGLEINNRIEAGAVYFPGLDEMVYAGTDLGAFWNGRRTFVNKTTDFNRAIVAFTELKNMEKYGKTDAWNRIQNSCYYTVGWADAYGHALVATGRLELMLDPIINPWDGGPFPVILREAGGVFCDWSGKETIHGDGGVSVTNNLLPDFLNLVRG